MVEDTKCAEVKGYSCLENCIRVHLCSSVMWFLINRNQLRSIEVAMM